MDMMDVKKLALWTSIQWERTVYASGCSIFGKLGHYKWKECDALCRPISTAQNGLRSFGSEEMMNRAESICVTYGEKVIDMTGWALYSPVYFGDKATKMHLVHFEGIKLDYNYCERDMGT